MSKREETDANKPIASKQSEVTAQPRSNGATKFEYLRAIDPAPKTHAEVLADGIFAVAMTILVLDINLPHLTGDISAAQYLHSVLALWPKLIVFVASSIALARLWQLHRNIFHFLERSDQQLLFWNLLSLMPALYGMRDFVEAGGMMAYGPNTMVTWRRAAEYVDKILRGADPGELPIEQPTQYSLTVNTKVAKALGITIPEAILLRADEVMR